MPSKPRPRRRLHERPAQAAPRQAPAAAWIWTCVVAALCSAFAFLVIQHARSTSATYDETSHLPSGYTYLRWSDYRLNPEHPPLVKKLAALPVLAQRPWPPDLDLHPADAAARPETDSLREIKRAWARGLAQIESQWTFGHQFLYGVRDATLQRLGATDPLALPSTAVLDAKDYVNDATGLLFSGRMMIMALGVLLAILIFLWARDLHGPAGGVLALALFCFDPNFIAHSGLVTTDVGAALFMYGAVYFLWRTCRRMDAVGPPLFLLCCALALATKFTAVLLAPILGLVLLARVVSADPWPIGRQGRWTLGTPRSRAVAAVGLLAAAALVSYVMIWASYGFRYSAASDPERAARAEALVSGQAGRGAFLIEDVVRRTAATNVLMRYRGADGGLPDVTPAIRAEMDDAPVGVSGAILLFAYRHRLLPEAYVYGLALAQIQSLERGSFLRGEYSDRGFWNYFLWTFALKTPILTMAAVRAALVCAIRRRDPWGSRLAFLIVPVVVYWGVCLGSSLNIGHRHLLPIYPFLFVLCGGLVREWAALRPALRPRVACLALAAIVVGNLLVFAPPWRPALVYPHYLAYFNELAGGPRNGDQSLVDSNLDWGQDLEGLQRWLAQRHIDAPVYLCYFGMADPRFHRIAHHNAPHALGGYPFEAAPDVNQFLHDLRSGDHLAISATHRVGVYLSHDAWNVWRLIIDQSTFVDTVGYSIFIYRIGTGR